jgi:Ca2+-binding EF-hand superfamily protein
LVPYEFANLLHNLGMELDDRYNLKAFNAIDTDGDRKISFEEFCDWWNAGYIERGRRYNNHASAEGNYDDLSRCS